MPTPQYIRQEPVHPTDVIDYLFPTDGPFDAERTGQAAQCLAHLVRYLNYATNTTADTGLNVAYPVLGSLVRAVEMLDQTTRQLRAGITAAAGQPGAHLDSLPATSGHYPLLLTVGATAGLAGDNLTDAGSSLHQLRSQLMTAQVYAGRIVPGDTDDEGSPA